MARLENSRTADGSISISDRGRQEERFAQALQHTSARENGEGTNNAAGSERLAKNDEPQRFRRATASIPAEASRDQRGGHEVSTGISRRSMLQSGALAAAAMLGTPAATIPGTERSKVIV